VLDQKHLFIDRTRLLENIESNIQSTRNRTMADMERVKANVLARTRTEKIVAGVGKMYDEYLRKGYYHRDYMHSIRIAACVLHFMQTDHYSLKTEEFDPIAFDMCCSIKQNPDKFTKKELDDFLDSYLGRIDRFDLEGDEEKFRFDAMHVQKSLVALYA